MLQVNDKVALVFGGNGGIGKCTVNELLKNDVKAVVIADLIDTGIVASIDAAHERGKAAFVQVDVTNAEEVKNAFNLCIKKFDAIDIVIICAAIVNEDDYINTIRINLIGSMHVVYEAYKYLPKHKSSATEQGVIISLASAAGLAPFEGIPVYSSAKSGLVAFGRSISKQTELLGDFSVKLITLCPSTTETPMLDDCRKMCETTTGELQKALTAVFKKMPAQKPESVAKCILHIIRHGNNGSFWVSRNDNDAELIDYDAIYALALSTFAD